MSDAQLAVQESGAWTDMGLDDDRLDEDSQIHRGGKKKKLLIGVALTLLAGAGIAYTVHAKQMHVLKGLTSAQLNGNWVLSANAVSQFPGVIKQTVQFSGGSVKGTTILRADSPAGTAHLPFPDHSVDSVTESGDGYKLTANWHGTYKILSGNRVDLTIGKADYTLHASLNSKSHTLTFSHDVLLVGGSSTIYSAS